MGGRICVHNIIFTEDYAAKSLLQGQLGLLLQLRRMARLPVAIFAASEEFSPVKFASFTNHILLKKRYNCAVYDF